MWQRFGILGVMSLLLSGGSSLAAKLPPSVDREPTVHSRLEAAYRAMSPDYEPRTHLMDGDQPRYINRLIEEPSPYLRQHAHNPVDWHPWSKETLAKAVAQKKLIFLSVGYATCHWCHVMEEESFDNEEVAALLNRYFIAIKIDREQQPDLDHLYMMATQLQQGSGGWPNTLWLTADGRPFHTATYLPKRYLMELTNGIASAWKSPAGQIEIENVATNLSAAVRQFTQIENAQTVPITQATFTQAKNRLLEMHNALEGGFSDSQQFPREGFLLFLLDHWRRSGDDEALEIAITTLDAMAAGGIHDHVGGGFHRYTVDPNWRTPHFEKMLYNQARIAQALTEAWSITGKESYRRAAERTLNYVERDMTDPQGAFYSAEDADSRNARGERAEGAFYAFTAEQAQALGLDNQLESLGLLERATIEEGAVIHLDPFEQTDFQNLAAPLELLRAVREQRTRPLRDDKVIAGWNGLMIRALADAAMAFDNTDYVRLGAQAGDAIWQRLWQSDTQGERLFRIWVDGEIREAGTLDDYAWLGLGYVALFDATGESIWRERAVKLAKAIDTHFSDGSGRLRMSAIDGPLGPIYDNEDSAVPAAESSAMEFLARLAMRSNDLTIQSQALGLRNALSADIVSSPMARTDALIAGRLIEEGESTSWQSMAKGNVQVIWRNRSIELAIADGWHVNAHEPGDEWLIGATLKGAVANWPDGQTFNTGFNDKPIQVYEGRISIPVSDHQAKQFELTLQVCSHELCLEPETAKFRQM